MYQNHLNFNLIQQQKISDKSSTSGTTGNELDSKPPSDWHDRMMEYMKKRDLKNTFYGARSIQSLKGLFNARLVKLFSQYKENRVEQLN